MTKTCDHAPEGYLCPFCLVARGGESEPVRTKQSDVVYRDAFITAFIASSWFGDNAGHVLIVPNAHHENIYTLPDETSARIHAMARRVAIAMKHEYGCDGVSTRQHNEPAGNQDVWHYHLHVFPRYDGDGLYAARRRDTTPEERRPYAERLRAWLS